MLFPFFQHSIIPASPYTSWLFLSTLPKFHQGIRSDTDQEVKPPLCNYSIILAEAVNLLQLSQLA